MSFPLRRRDLIRQAAAASLLRIGGLAAMLEPGPEWRKKNSYGNRYEGLLSGEKVSGPPPLELLSFCAFFEDFSGDVDLHVKFFLPHAAPAVIQARELDESLFYWMESNPQSTRWNAGAWNDFKPWPTSAVLNRKDVRIPAFNLGVTVYLTRPGCIDCTAAPAIVYHSRPPQSVQRYKWSFRPGSPISVREYTLSQVIGGREKAFASASVAEEKLGRFDLDVDVSRLPEGLCRLSLRTRQKNEIAMRAVGEYTFYHKPAVS
jgi:hypothetical protein